MVVTKGYSMKSLLWMVNSILALLLTMLFVFMFLLKKPIIRRTSILPPPITSSLETEASKINPIRIYESDLFRTHVKAQLLIPSEETEKPVVPPMPPQPKSFMKKPRATPEFLSPLDVELKGIIYNSNSLYSRAIIMNKKTNTESLCKIGDSVEDAHLIFISKHKALFIRSNGQQETLFVSAEAAQKDPLYAPPQISSAVERIDEFHYLVNTMQFAKEIQNLAQFLDMLDITTAFDKGQVIGCRIGKITPKSIGAALGLQYGDIITKINDISATTTSNRVKIFKQLLEAQNNQQISAIILRAGSPLALNYTLQQEFQQKKIPDTYKQLPAGTLLPAEVQYGMRNNKKSVEVTEQTLQQAHANNAVADVFKRNDQKSMIDFGGRNGLVQR